MEGRRPTKENTEQSDLAPDAEPERARVERAAAVCGKQHEGTSKLRFTALLHHVTVALLRASFFALKREAAPGVDGVTWRQYRDGPRRRGWRPA